MTLKYLRNFKTATNIDDGVGPYNGPEAFTRESTAQYWDEDSVLQTAAVDEPRLDHDPVTGERIGLLLEGNSKTNILLWNRDLTQSEWAKVRASISANSGVAPNGATEMDSIVENTANDTHYCRQSVTFDGSSWYVLHGYVRAAGREWVKLNLPNGSFSGAAPEAFFQLTGAGVVGTNNNTAFHGIRRIGTTDVYQIWVSGLSDSAGSGFCTISLASADNTDSYQGDGSSGIEAWGFNCYVAGSSGQPSLNGLLVPHSTIYSEGTAATREDDRFNVGIPGQLNSNGLGFVTYLHILNLNMLDNGDYDIEPTILRTSYISVREDPFTVQASLEWKGGNFRAYNNAPSGPENGIANINNVTDREFRVAGRFITDPGDTGAHKIYLSPIGSATVESSDDSNGNVLLNQQEESTTTFAHTIGGDGVRWDGWIVTEAAYDSAMNESILEELVKYGPGSRKYAAGTMVDDEGRVQVVDVNKDDEPETSDVFIEGTRHTVMGRMYITTDAVVEAEVKPIVGIAHHAISGVRYTQTGDTTNEVTKALTTDADGAQAVSTDSPDEVVGGIGVKSDGSMCIIEAET